MYTYPQGNLPYAIPYKHKNKDLLFHDVIQRDY